MAYLNISIQAGNRVFPMEIYSKAKISHLRNKVAEQIGQPANTFELYFGQDPLNDAYCLDEYGIKDGATVSTDVPHPSAAASAAAGGLTSDASSPVEIPWKDPITMRITVMDPSGVPHTYDIEHQTTVKALKDFLYEEGVSPMNAAQQTFRHQGRVLADNLQFGECKLPTECSIDLAFPGAPSKSSSIASSAISASSAASGVNNMTTTAGASSASVAPPGYSAFAQRAYEFVPPPAYDAAAVASRPSLPPKKQVEEARPTLGAEFMTGPVVRRVDPNSVAAEAGFRAGDVLVAVDGRPVTSASDVNPNNYMPGQQMKFSIFRPSQGNMQIDMIMGANGTPSQQLRNDIAAQRTIVTPLDDRRQYSMQMAGAPYPNGRIQMGAWYEEPTGMLHIHAAQAQNLHLVGNVSNLQPYCKLHLLPDVKSKFKSKILQGKNPQWNDHIKIPFPGGLQSLKDQCALDVQVWHSPQRGTLEPNKEIGSITLKLDRIATVPAEAAWYPLHPAGVRPEKREVAVQHPLNVHEENAFQAAIRLRGYRPYMGLDFFSDGAYVKNVVPRQPLWKSGVVNGDILTCVGNTPVNSAGAVAAAMQHMRPGDRLDFDVIMAGTDARGSNESFRSALIVGQRDTDYDAYLDTVGKSALPALDRRMAQNVSPPPQRPVAQSFPSAPSPQQYSGAAGGGYQSPPVMYKQPSTVTTTTYTTRNVLVSPPTFISPVMSPVLIRPVSRVVVAPRIVSYVAPPPVVFGSSVFF